MSDKLRKQAEENRILEIRSGSHLYGTSTPESDEDFAGIFMPPEEYVYGLQSVQEIELGIKDKNADGKNTADAVDRKLYEFRKFVSLAQGNNPNIIEMLFVNQDNIVYINDFGKELLTNKHLFPSKLAAKKFVGYAHSQKHKMIIRRDHFNALRAGYKYLDEFNDKNTMSQVVDKLHDNLLTEPFTQHQAGGHIHCGDICFEPGVYVKKARRMLKERLDKATNRSELVLKYGYDTKFASHLIRLLTEGIQMLRDGELIFPIPHVGEVLDIKSGKWSIDEVIKYADDLEAQLDDVLEKSNLPATPHHKEIEKLTIKLMKSHL